MTGSSISKKAETIVSEEIALCEYGHQLNALNSTDEDACRSGAHHVIEALVESGELVTPSKAKWASLRVLAEVLQRIEVGATELEAERDALRAELSECGAALNTVEQACLEARAERGALLDAIADHQAEMDSVRGDGRYFAEDDALYAKADAVRKSES